MESCTDTIRFNGERFRSIRQAQWGAFFDHLHVLYIYGVVSYHLPAGLVYTPHFWLVGQRLWFQVGEEDRHDDDFGRWRTFASAIRSRPYGVKVTYAPGANGHDDPSVILDKDWRPLESLYSIGGIPDPATMTATGPSPASASMQTLGVGGYQWTICPTCTKLDADRNGRTNHLRCGHGNHRRAEDPQADHPRLLDAYRFAQRTRPAHAVGRCLTCGEAVHRGDLILPGSQTGQQEDHAHCHLPRAHDRSGPGQPPARPTTRRPPGGPGRAASRHKRR
ncbi:hypothetical protein AB0F81_20180 [Actinoplanes sp. NPDC024001]|uniref:hypothetical protein n=1 Tax=unclassified Actinoplanes TaxID=2626549 RepID=UPI002E1CB63B